MFGSLTLEELTELCVKMDRALYAAHDASVGSKSLEEWNGRRDVHADLMSIQPDLWHACRADKKSASRLTSGTARSPRAAWLKGFLPSVTRA